MDKAITFPHAYLDRRVGVQTSAKKAAAGICKHWCCVRPRRLGGPDCEVCKKRKQRRSDDVRYAFDNLRASAARRGIGFNLTIAQFRKWDELHDYCSRRGPGIDDMSLDRIHSDKPYSLGNIRMLTMLENCSRHIEGLTEDWQPLAKELLVATQFGDIPAWKEFAKNQLGEAEDGRGREQWIARVLWTHAKNQCIPSTHWDKIAKRVCAMVDAIRKANQY